MEVGSEKEKNQALAMHLFKIFKPNPQKIILEEENKLLSDAITTAIVVDT